MQFILNDFDALISGDKYKISKVNNKFRNLVKKVSTELDYFFIIRKCKDGCSGYLARSTEREAVINFQLNSEDFSIEFILADKNLILKFIKTIPEIH